LARNGARLRLPHALMLVLLGAAVFGWSISRGIRTLDDRFFFWGVPAAAVVYASLSFPEVKGAAGRLLELLGDASYSTYLSHMFTIGALHWVGDRWIPLGTGVFMAVAFFASLALGVVSYRLIEQPLLQMARFGTGRLLRRPT
jgi:exopolysaccharide production protein ExoZ